MRKEKIMAEHNTFISVCNKCNERFITRKGSTTCPQCVDKKGEIVNCPNCGEEGPHFVPPSLGEPGFFTCKKKEQVVNNDIKIPVDQNNEPVAPKTPAKPVYTQEHVDKCKEERWHIYNPHNKPEYELPVIFGFNNGGRVGWFHGTLIAEDGTQLGSHLCTHEGYMYGDLGVLTGMRADRHVEFVAHYPDGYRMEFVGYAEVGTHAGLQHAFFQNALKEAK